MVGIFHGYVSHNQMVGSKTQYSLGTNRGGGFDMPLILMWTDNSQVLPRKSTSSEGHRLVKQLDVLPT